MFVEFEAKVRREQYRDLRREADRERLLHQRCAGRQATQGIEVLSLIRHIVGWLRANRSRLRLLSRSGEKMALSGSAFSGSEES